MTEGNLPAAFADAAAFGAAAQKRISAIADRAFRRVMAMEDDISESELTGLLGLLREEPEKQRGIFARLFGGYRRKKHAKQLAAAVDALCESLELQKNRLLEDGVLFGHLHRASEETCGELTRLIEAGQAARSGALPENQRDALDRRLHDLELARAVGMQTSAELLLLRQMSDRMSERIGEALQHTLTLWKNQRAVALRMQAVQHADRGLEAALQGMLAEQQKEADALEALALGRNTDRRNEE
jgi:uncharacterized protein YaaN involved in tellurite resistance